MAPTLSAVAAAAENAVSFSVVVVSVAKDVAKLEVLHGDFLEGKITPEKKRDIPIRSMGSIGIYLNLLILQVYPLIESSPINMSTFIYTPG